MTHCRGAEGRRELQFYPSDSDGSDNDELLVPPAEDCPADHTYWSSSDDSVFEEEGEDLPSLGDERYYVALPELVYRNSFSMDALLNSTSMTTFIDDLPEYSEKDKTMADLVDFKSKTNLSREGGNALLQLISSFEPRRAVPQDWRTMSRYVDRKCHHLQGRTLRQGVPWPAEWEMETWDQGGHDYPLEVELIVRDPLELIALKLVCPTTQYMWKDHIMYEYEERHITDSDVKCWCELMTSNYAKHTEASVRALNPDGILLWMVTYADKSYGVY